MLTKTNYYQRSHAQLHFECFKCGNCCRQQHLISLTGKDIVRVSKYLNISRKDFIINHARKIGNVWYLRNMMPYCEFLVNNECIIHEAKPSICREYPYLLNLHPDAGVFVIEGCLGSEDAMIQVIAHEHELSGNEEQKKMEESKEFKDMERRIIDKMMKREFG